MPSQSTTADPRDTRAAALLIAGAVTLNFDGTATVKGSGKAVYTIRRDADGTAHCDCPDCYQRGARCKHLRAVEALCKLARACRQQAQQTGRTRLPYLLGLALRGQANPAACQDCGVSIPVGKWCRPCLDASLFGPVAALPREVA